ncbi:hypothetical protein [Haloquadratum walsbyi]|uniref:Uncharacterized protein n=1 Tax=Haloquadratum walsbyi J07HQW2 TaxID=1238425 RepID=U1PKW3_9EURY|nr:hypothetical protein [Haloquadratum walsbyi]ERG94332.1 MAG: hypothetical protein J07HQW2_00766 [Haloquadratum walsbyi J07HQW2]
MLGGTATLKSPTLNSRSGFLRLKAEEDVKNETDDGEFTELFPPAS